MEVLCDESIRIWHIFFGCPGTYTGTYNYLNTLGCSPLFADVKVGSFPPAAPVVNIEDFQLSWFYWLTDGIYPRWSRFFSAYREPSTAEEKSFNAHKEEVRKSVERVFGVLFKRFGIMYQPARVHHVEAMRSIVLCCVILHNMIVEERKDAYIGLQGTFEYEAAFSGTLVNPLPKASNMAERIEQWNSCRNLESSSFHCALRDALKRHISSKE